MKFLWPFGGPRIYSFLNFIVVTNTVQRYLLNTLKSISTVSLLSCLVFFLDRANCYAASDEPKTFLETGPGVYQSTSLREKVIVSYDQPGILIISSVPIGIQEFDPTLLETKLAKHIFIAYDPSTNRYSELIVNGKTYNIKGSLSLLIGRASVSIDNINPYLSISVEADQSIISFRGLQLAANASGDLPLTFLEANQLDEYSDLIVPYELRKEGAEQELYLKDSPVMSTNIGLNLQPPKNPCVGDNHQVYLTEKDLESIKSISQEDQRFDYIENAFSRNAKERPLKDSITLKITKTTSIHFNLHELSIKRVTPMKNRFGDKIVCVINNFKIE